MLSDKRSCLPRLSFTVQLAKVHPCTLPIKTESAQMHAESVGAQVELPKNCARQSACEDLGQPLVVHRLYGNGNSKLTAHDGIDCDRPRATRLTRKKISPPALMLSAIERVLVEREVRSGGKTIQKLHTWEEQRPRENTLIYHSFA